MKKTSENKGMSRISFIKTNTKQPYSNRNFVICSFNFLRSLKTVGNGMRVMYVF